MEPVKPGTGRAPEGTPLQNPFRDCLLPLPNDLCRTLHRGHQTWESFLRAAQSQARGSWPNDLLNPYIVLDNVPALPEKLLRRRLLTGRPCWRILRHDDPTIETDTNTEWNPHRTHGNQVTISLRRESPVICDISDQAASLLLDNRQEAAGPLAVLTLSWAYIFCARLLEAQGLAIRYTSHRIHPRPSGVFERLQAEQYTLHLGEASPHLVRWLCCILSTEMGWRPYDPKHPERDMSDILPWSALLSKGGAITVAASAWPSIADYTGDAPSSTEAIELLIEFCGLFGLTAVSNPFDDGALAPCNAAFLAALVLPFYGSSHLTPCFPHPRLQPRSTRFSQDDERRIREYLADTRYFMTLSLHWIVFASCSWSVFWQPDIACNLVSPWLASISRTLRPIIEAKDLETLLKVFIARRPRCGLWWVALFLLGDRSILDWIPKYLAEMEERWGYGSLSPPDLLAAPWTGTTVSFLDMGLTRSYKDDSFKVQREDWLRCRLDFKLQDSGCVPLAWLPFGNVDRADVEPELWPLLEKGGHRREYLHFTWYHKYKTSTRKAESLGFHRETGRGIKDVPDDLVLRESRSLCPGRCLQGMPELPSEDVTQRMLDLLVENATYERHWKNAVLPGAPWEYRWLKEWEGLATMDTAPRESSDGSKRQCRSAIDSWIQGVNHAADGEHNALSVPRPLPDRRIRA